MDNLLMDIFTYGHDLWTIYNKRYISINTIFDDIETMWATVVK